MSSQNSEETPFSESDTQYNLDFLTLEYKVQQRKKTALKIGKASNAVLIAAFMTGGASLAMHEDTHAIAAPIALLGLTGAALAYHRQAKRQHGHALLEDMFEQNINIGSRVLYGTDTKTAKAAQMTHYEQCYGADPWKEATYRRPKGTKLSMIASCVPSAIIGSIAVHQAIFDRSPPLGLLTGVSLFAFEGLNAYEKYLENRTSHYRDLLLEQHKKVHDTPLAATDKKE